MTKKLGELTEIPLGDVVVLQPPGQPKKNTNTFSGRKVVNVILAVVVATAVTIGVLSAAGVDFSSSKTNDNIVNSNALTQSDGDIATASESPTDSPVSQIVGKTECIFQNSFDVNGDGSLILRGGIDSEESTVTVELEYAGEAWLGFAFSDSPTMVPNTAIIGLPIENKVEKYSLISRSLEGVSPLNERQTLSATSIVQSNGNTKLTFTKPLSEANEVSISGVGDIRFNWAVGSSNELGLHALRGSTVALFAACLIQENDENAAQTTQPTSAVAPDLGAVAPTLSPVPAAPVISATSKPSISNSEVPTNKPTSSPTDSSTSAPTRAPVPTATPIEQGVIYSKVGNRRSCSIEACPSSSWSGDADLANGCSCDMGLDTCYWDGSPTTIEYFSGVILETTNTQGLWKLTAKGDKLSLGEGGDFASGSDCFDDALRGGFYVDLSGTGLVFSEQSSVTVSGYSPVMQVTADGTDSQEVRQWGQDAELNVRVPEGTKILDVKCGGWPAYCTSELYVARVGGSY